MTSHNFFVREKEYSEDVVRRSLYWLSADYQWRMERIDDRFGWDIVVESSDSRSEIENKFCRLLNDHLLRERLDFQTSNARRNIVNKVIHDIEKSL